MTARKRPAPSRKPPAPKQTKPAAKVAPKLPVKAAAAKPAPKPAAKPAAAAKAAPGGTHVVAKGDTLGGLAARYYGDSSKAGKIRAANTDKLKGDKSLQVGMKLKIPK